MQFHLDAIKIHLEPLLGACIQHLALIVAVFGTFTSHRLIGKEHHHHRHQTVLVCQAKFIMMENECGTCWCNNLDSKKCNIDHAVKILLFCHPSSVT